MKELIRPARSSTFSIAGPLSGPTWSLAPYGDGYTSTTLERPRPPAPEPSRQVRRAAARRKAKGSLLCD